ncbi:MAG: glycoside hydrolase family 99-like domain-containing protein [Paracoccaceae bacterium]|nr:glycoside hydrolase family 99-like domain-containing protein [Paracoccaceae bacterium]MDG2259853.1 glycoside hydrolase family 99-like domain-containing protein [Paracoccaceae bacterium]
MSKPPSLPGHLDRPIELVTRSQRAQFACHVHVHYGELWSEILAAVNKMGLKIDLYVTLSYRGAETKLLKQRILSDCPKCEVFILENRGRDILPFLTLLCAGAFQNYSAVCKIHTKRSLHRADGDRWRKRLINGIASGQTPHLLNKFLSDPDLSIWVADGQALQSNKWWGVNKSNVDNVLARIGLSIASHKPYFPSGSMYWIKPFTLGMLKSLQLGPSDFEDETGAVDGTTAHAVERVVGELALAAGHKIIETTALMRRQPKAAEPSPDYVSAFYLPQFHQVRENDGWWGAGYTEWTAVKSAKKQFADHLLRRPASNTGCYDLADANVMVQQAKMAKANGIDAFCVYFYWFGRKRLLKKPIDQLLASPDVQFPFYLCWANESWRRSWDGLSGDVLIEQRYPVAFENDLANETAAYLRDLRYQKPDGKRLRFVIYRPADLPNPSDNIANLRSAWRKLGFGEVEIGGVIFHTNDKIPEQLVDFWIEMPPHGFIQPNDYLNESNAPNGLSDQFRGVIYDYRNLTSRTSNERNPDNTIAGVMPSWDNSPRRGPNGHIAYGATPAGFRKWLRETQTHRLKNSYRNELMINAWNEWGESAVLEPCERFGNLNLRAVREITLTS